MAHYAGKGLLFFFLLQSVNTYITFCVCICGKPLLSDKMNSQNKFLLSCGNANGANMKNVQKKKERERKVTNLETII